MQYYSLNNRSTTADFRKATLEGQSPDGGLYFPENIPVWSSTLVDAFKKMSKAEIGFEVMKPYVGNCISSEKLFSIMEDTLAFGFPLKKIDEQTYALELFHGPTLAFKDLGARFLSRCMGHFAQDQEKKMVVLVATSGDTGGAVADAFYKIPGTTVVILYPSGKVSPVQEKQLTGLGGNIHALEVEGDFDDCQRIVKEAFLDEDLKKGIMLTSSNSINVSRWLPQQIYYLLAFAQWEEKTAPVFCVPSGNFGNLCAGLVAGRSGMPAAHFIAACNANHVFTDYIRNGTYAPASTVPTLSNAMDVGNPSNFIRIRELYHHNHEAIKKDISSYWISDEKTKNDIRAVYEKQGYLMDPHTAVAYAAMKAWQHKNSSTPGIILSTAHPIKFPGVVEEAIGSPIAISEQISILLGKEKKSIRISADYTSFKNAFGTVMDQSKMD